MLVFNMLYNMKLRIKFQKSVKKVPVCLACKVKSRTFAPAFRKGRCLRAAGMKGAAKKIPQKFGGLKNPPYLCKRFPPETGGGLTKAFNEIIWIRDEKERYCASCYRVMTGCNDIELDGS